MRSDEENRVWYDDLCKHLDQKIIKLGAPTKYIDRTLNNESIIIDFSSKLQRVLERNRVRSWALKSHKWICWPRHLELQLVFAEANAWMKRYAKFPDSATAYARQKVKRYGPPDSASQHAQRDSTSDSLSEDSSDSEFEALYWATLAWLLEVSQRQHTYKTSPTRSPGDQQRSASTPSAMTQTERSQTDDKSVPSSTSSERSARDDAQPIAESEPVSAVSEAGFSLVVAIAPKYEGRASADGLAEGRISKEVGTALLAGYMYIGTIETADSSLKTLRDRASADTSDAEGDRLVAVVQLPDDLVLGSSQRPNREFERAFERACEEDRVTARWVRASGDVLGTIPLVGQQGKRA